MTDILEKLERYKGDELIMDDINEAKDEIKLLRKIIADIEHAMSMPIGECILEAHREALRVVVERESIHTPEDGKGQRDIFVDGKLINQVFYADTKRGVVRAYKEPLQLAGNRAATETHYGKVTVKFKCKEES